MAPADVKLDMANPNATAIGAVDQDPLTVSQTLQAQVNRQEKVHRNIVNVQPGY